MDTNAQSAGIAAIKPKRKYTKRKPKIALVKPKVRKELPKTARAYLNTLGMKADKEGTAVAELVKMHSELLELVKGKPDYKTITLMTAAAPILHLDGTADIEAEPFKPVSLWQRWFGK